ncbi:MAG: alpha/beta fold hydrolase [Rhizobiaceae bacterium]
MNIFAAIGAFALALLFGLAGVSRVNAWLIERRHPPVGAFAEIAGARIHYVRIPAAAADLPPVVFIHGASGNLNDEMVPLRPVLEGRAEMLFLDRPGHGWSTRGDGHETPEGQADAIAALMDTVGIGRAVIVGHSFGGAVAAAFALAHPERTAGLVFLAAATHPWPGGATSWYYSLAAAPVIGRLFSETIAGPAGTLRMAAATECVFAPNAIPDRYLERAQIPLVLRPSSFRYNAIDVEGLFRHVEATAGRYREIVAPTVVISGDSDTVVYEEIHSVGLARDIPGAEIVWVRNLGHKPDWVVPELVVAAIEKVSGSERDLAAMAAAAEARIAGDSFGAGCIDDKAPGAGELAPG